MMRIAETTSSAARTAAVNLAKVLPSPLAQAKAAREQLVMSQIVDLAAVREESFYVSDVSVVENQFSRWSRELPRVKPYYAVKCSPDPVLIRTLADLGAGFDCASKGEIDLVSDAGVKADRVLFANPQKKIGDLRHSQSLGVKRMTFDSADELLKIAQHAPTAEVILRLLPDDSRSIMKFGVKFGAPTETIRPLLELAKKLKLNVVGTSFHVGSGCLDASAYADAVKLSRHAFDVAAELGLHMSVVDIGGGFPGTLEDQTTSNGPVGENNTKAPTFEAITSALRPALNELFPAKSGVTLVGEPGRYFATAWSRLAVNVYGRREVPDCGAGKRFLYYINDGLYGSFNCLVFDHASVVPMRLSEFARTRKAHSSLEKRVLEPVSVLSPAAQSSADWLATMTTTVSTADTPLSASSRPVLSEDAFMRRGKPKKPVAQYSSTIFGPTCDSMDCIAKDIRLPELNVGEWLVFDSMGAYTKASASDFNGFKPPEVKYLSRSGALIN